MGATRSVRLQSEDFRVPFEDEGFVLEGVSLRKSLAAGSSPSGLGRHPVVMVAELVQEDVEQLIRTRGGFGKLQPIHASTLAVSDLQSVEEVLVVPGFLRDSGGEAQEAVKAIVRPAWEALESRGEHSAEHLRSEPKLLRNILWNSINECQQNSQQLSGFEKISSQHLEIRIEEFQKTSTGKIKRELYMKDAKVAE